MSRRTSMIAVMLLLGATRAEAMPLRVMSFNTWHARSHVDGGVQKVVDAIVAADADVVALQESEGRLATEVAAALGWSALQGPASVAIVSRFPITEVFPLARDAAALGARRNQGAGRRVPRRASRSERGTGNHVVDGLSRRRRGKTDAVVTFPAGTLPAGDYVAHLLYANGYGVLTSGAPFLRD